MENDADFIDGDHVVCWQCGGEGTVSDCFEEYACMAPEEGCDLCTRRCDICKGKGSWKYVPTEDRT